MEWQLMFAPVATPRSRWKSFVIGWGVQAQLVLAVLVLNAMFPKQSEQLKRYVATGLVAPTPAVMQDARRVNPRVAVNSVPKPVAETPTLAKLIVPRPVHAIREPELEVKPPQIEPTSKTPVLPRLADLPVTKVLAMNGFATPANAMATTTKSAKVQTGGFGDPNAIPATGDGKHGLNMAAKGDLGLPRGAGFGNGLVGAVGARGVGIVRSAIQSSGFDKQYAAPAPQQTVIATNEPGSPVEIIDKPQPSYTAEARKLGVEGEVRLEVQFAADGHVHVLRVLHGLGFGLDQQALHCAEHIRFKPATHAGQPIDSTAVVHIVFELAS